MNMFYVLVLIEKKTAFCSFISCHHLTKNINKLSAQFVKHVTVTTL